MLVITKERIISFMADVVVSSLITADNFYKIIIGRRDKIID